MENIPVDIGTHIASLIGLQRDVANLCLVSSQWAAVGRPILYKHLRLRYHSPNVRHTLNMLNRTRDLKRYVNVLTLSGPLRPPTIHEARIKEADLQGMDNLHTLRIFKFHLIPIWIVQKTIGNVYSAVPGLEKVISYGAYEKNRGQAKTLPISPAKLKHVKVGCTLIDDEFLQTTFLLQPSSITSLELNHIEQGIFNLLSTLKLPILNTFSTIISADTGNDKQTNILANFLASHPTIQTCGIFSDFGLRVNALTPRNILPNLLILSGTPSIVMDLAKICDSFKFITSLSINANGYNVDRILPLFQRIGCFARLRHFEIMLPVELTSYYLKSMVSYITEIKHLSLPLLRLNESNSAITSYIIYSLSLFPKLERLDVGNGSDITLAQMTLLAQNNKTLQEIRIMELDGGDHKVLVRDEDHNKSMIPKFGCRSTTDRIWWQDSSLQ